MQQHVDVESNVIYVGVPVDKQSQSKVFGWKHKRMNEWMKWNETRNENCELQIQTHHWNGKFLQHMM